MTEQFEELNIEQLQAEIERLKKCNYILESKNWEYEKGDTKLYYSLQRKMSEMAKVLNNNSLENVDMVSKSDATFERVFKLLEKSETISAAASGLGIIAGITGNEQKDLAKKSFVDSIAIKRD